MKTFLLVTAVAVAAAIPQYDSHTRPEVYDPQDPPKYEFEYSVKDHATVNDYGQREARDGQSTAGSYEVRLPDSRLQRVVYSVDGDSGFIADVEFDGEAQHPDEYSRGTTSGGRSYDQTKPRSHSEPARRGYASVEPKTSYGPAPSQPKASYGPAPSQPKASYRPAPSQPKTSYRPAPSQPKVSYGPAPSQPKRSYGLAPSPPKTSYGPAPSQPRTRYGPAPSPPKTSYGRAPSQPKVSYGLAPSPPKTSYGPAPSPPKRTYGPTPSPPKTSYGPAPSPPKRTYGPTPSPPKTSYRPAQSPPKTSYGPAPSQPEISYSPAAETTSPPEPSVYGNKKLRFAHVPSDVYDKPLFRSDIEKAVHSRGGSGRLRAKQVAPPRYGPSAVLINSDDDKYIVPDTAEVPGLQKLLSAPWVSYQKAVESYLAKEDGHAKGGGQGTVTYGGGRDKGHSDVQESTETRGESRDSRDSGSVPYGARISSQGSRGGDDYPRYKTIQ